MVKFINRTHGNEMWVADDRVDEYKAAGHKLAASSITTKKEPEEKKPETKKPVKKIIKKG